MGDLSAGFRESDIGTRRDAHAGSGVEPKRHGASLEGVAVTGKRIRPAKRAADGESESSLRLNALTAESIQERLHFKAQGASRMGTSLIVRIATLGQNEHFDRRRFVQRQWGDEKLTHFESRNTDLRRGHRSVTQAADASTTLFVRGWSARLLRLHPISSAAFAPAHGTCFHTTLHGSRNTRQPAVATERANEEREDRESDVQSLKHDWKIVLPLDPDNVKRDISRKMRAFRIATSWITGTPT